MCPSVLLIWDDDFNHTHPPSCHDYDIKTLTQGTFSGGAHILFALKAILLLVEINTTMDEDV